MKNIQVIDGADNCTFPIFQATDDEFFAIFPNDKDLEFIEDLIARLGEEKVSATLISIWEKPIMKPLVQGIHGTLFYEFENKKHHFPKTRKEKDFDSAALNPAQRRLYAQSS